MYHLFLDANLFLSFYRLPKDDIDELAKLDALIRKEQVDLYVTSHLRDEVWRNREAQLDETLKRLDAVRPGDSFPQVLRNFTEFADLHAARLAYVEQLGALETRVRADAGAVSLPADVLIAELFEVATELPTPPELVDRAIRRSELGNPPGKPKSYGDAIHWEALLTASGRGDFHLVTADDDFSSPLDRSSLARFLKVEWRERSSATRIHLHRSLSAFFAAAGLQINLHHEAERSAAVSELVDSGSYSATHRAIRRLRPFDDFNVDEIDDLVDAFFHNSQVNALAGDADVQEFYADLLDRHGDRLDGETVHTLSGSLGFLEDYPY